jgi:uncharacterized membrane protein
MDLQIAVDVISRIVHVSTAIALVGGTVFMLFVLLPAAEELNAEEHDKLKVSVNRIWKRFVHLGILLFLLSGFYNYFRAMPLHKGDGLYHALIGIKMILAFVIFFIASILVGRSDRFEGMRRGRAKWLKILVVLAAIVVAVSGFAKVRGGKTVPANNAPIVDPVPIANDLPARP